MRFHEKKYHQGRRVLNSDTDFFWYKKKIDVDDEQKYAHLNSPEKYPCLVESRFDPNPNGPDEYIHTFYYKPIITCEHCGARTFGGWPDFGEDE